MFHTQSGAHTALSPLERGALAQSLAANEYLRGQWRADTLASTPDALLAPPWRLPAKRDGKLFVMPQGFSTLSGAI